MFIQHFKFASGAREKLNDITAILLYLRVGILCVLCSNFMTHTAENEYFLKYDKSVNFDYLLEALNIKKLNEKFTCIAACYV